MVVPGTGVAVAVDDVAFCCRCCRLPWLFIRIVSIQPTRTRRYESSMRRMTNVANPSAQQIASQLMHQICIIGKCTFCDRLVKAITDDSILHHLWITGCLPPDYETRPVRKRILGFICKPPSHPHEHMCATRRTLLAMDIDIDTVHSAVLLNAMPRKG